MKNFKVGDKVRAITNIYDYTSKENEWEGIIIDVYENRFDAITIKSKDNLFDGKNFYCLRNENFELIESQEEKKTPFQYLIEYYDIKLGEVFKINGIKVYFDENKVLRYEDGCPAHCYMTLIHEPSKVEKLPWKPKNGDIVWKVGTDGNIYACTYKEKLLSLVALIKLGWLFQTKEEAEANKERVLAEMKEVLNGTD